MGKLLKSILHLVVIVVVAAVVLFQFQLMYLKKRTELRCELINIRNPTIHYDRNLEI